MGLLFATSGVFSTSVRRFIMSSVIGGPSEMGLASTTKPYRKAPMTTDTPLTRLYGLIFVKVIFQSFRLLVQPCAPICSCFGSGVHWGAARSDGQGWAFGHREATCP